MGLGRSRGGANLPPGFTGVASGAPPGKDVLPRLGRGGFFSAPPALPRSANPTDVGRLDQRRVRASVPFDPARPGPSIWPHPDFVRQFCPLRKSGSYTAQTRVGVLPPTSSALPRWPGTKLQHQLNRNYKTLLRLEPAARNVPMGNAADVCTEYPTVVTHPPGEWTRVPPPGSGTTPRSTALTAANRDTFG